MPYVWDGHDNATRVQETGHGFKLDRYQWTDEELAAKVDAAINDPKLQNKLKQTSKAMQAKHGPTQAAEILEQLKVEFELTIVSAHRTPERLMDYAKGAYDKGLKVIIAGAGGAAHLPGMVASMTAVPVIGVPVKSSNSIDGWDSILSILQMPGGVPVATVALDGAKNAGLLAAKILASSEPELYRRLMEYKENMKEMVLKTAEEVEKHGYKRV